MKKTDDTITLDDQYKQNIDAPESEQQDSSLAEGDVDTDELRKVSAERDDWKSKCMRAFADYQNLVRRTKEEKEQDSKFASSVALTKLFPVFDLFLQADNHLKDAGLRIACKELDITLVKMGIDVIDPVGQPFDLETMECVEAHGKDTLVSNVVTRGYRMHGKLLRAAKVVVGQKELVDAVESP